MIEKNNLKAFIVLVLLVACLLSSSPVAAEDTESTFEISDLKVEPIEVKVEEEVTIIANVTNIGNVTASYEAILEINGKQLGSKTVTLAPNETETLGFIYVPTEEGKYIVTIGDKSAEFRARAVKPKLRVGPIVKLRPVNDIIDSSKDGLVELFFSNPSLNEEVMLYVEVYISVPAGIHVYGEGFGITTAAGTIYGQFEVPPGTARTIYINIKADKTTVGKTYFIHFSGIYYPNGNKDRYNPLSFTHPFQVVEASPDPHDSALTNPDQISDTNPDQTGGIFVGWTGVTPLIIVAVAVIGVALIVAMGRR